MRKELNDSKLSNSSLDHSIKKDMEDFKLKIRGLYSLIFQGSKVLSIRKNDLVRQIKKMDVEDGLRL